MKNPEVSMSWILWGANERHNFVFITIYLIFNEAPMLRNLLPEVTVQNLKSR